MVVIFCNVNSKSLIGGGSIRVGSDDLESLTRIKVTTSFDIE